MSKFKARILEFPTCAQIGGTQQELLKFLRYASHEKYQFSVCILLGHDRLNDEISALGIENINLEMRHYYDFGAWWRLYRFAKEKRVDLVHTYGLKAHIIGRIVGKCLRVPVNISSVHSTDPWRKWYHVLLERLTSRLTDLYISNSQAGRLATHQRERIPLRKIITIPNGIDVTEYESYHTLTFEEINALKQRFGIASTAPVIGIVANFRQMKGHKTIVDALPRVLKSFPELKCLFVGSDLWHGTVQEYIREKQLERTVICIGFQQNIPEILAILDIFLLPSLWEGLPTSVMEAMAMKKPVIASTVGGIPELVEHEVTGLLIPPNDPVRLADEVIRLLNNPAWAAQLGQAGYKKIQQDFALTSSVAKIEEVYDQLITEKAS